MPALPSASAAKSDFPLEGATRGLPAEDGAWAKGAAAALAGIITISPDSLLIRLMSLTSPTVACGRGALSGLGLAVLASLMARRRQITVRAFFGMTGPPGFVVAALSAGTNVLFIVAISRTSVANTLVIFTSLPLMTAVLSRAVLGERVQPETWFASVVALGAIGLIFVSAVSGVGLSGDIAAFGSTCLAAGHITITRRYRTRSMVPGMAGAGIISAVTLVAFADFSPLTVERSAFMIIDGLIVIPVALSLLIIAPRYARTPIVALFYLLETVLGPLWVWLVLGEIPPGSTFIAGGLLLVAIAGQCSIQAARLRTQNYGRV
jgi:drug/metabolite transporter (DMT)-like permease